jgi:hypothetical protein
MRWVNWEYIDENENNFPHVHDSFRLAGIDTFIGRKLTSWSDDMIM